MRKLTTVLLALVALVALALFVLPGLLEREDSKRGPEAVAASPDQVRDAELAAVTSLEGGPADAARDRRAEVAPGTGGPGAASVAGADRPMRTVEGHVQLPGGVPNDPTLRVLALAREHSPAELYSDDGILAADELPAEVSVAAVDGDGSFAIAVPAGAEAAWLALDGRFLFSKRCSRLEADATDAEIAPSLGSWIVGEVALPEDVEASPDLFAAMEAELGPDSTQFSMVDAGDGLLFDRRASVDADGRFEFRAVDAGRPYEIELASEELANHLADGLTFEAGREETMAIGLRHGAVVSGVVRDEAGAPLAEATVRAFRTAMWGFPGRTLAETSSAEDGTFELRAVPAGSVGVHALVEGRLESTAKTIQTVDRGSVDELVLVVEDGLSIKGVAEWEGGRPVAGVEVEASFDPEAMMGMSAMNAARGASGKATTGEDGSFVISGLGKGPFVVSVSARPDGVPAERAPWTASQSPVAPGSELRLVLRELPSLAGRVEDATGAPVSDFRVLANQAGAVFFAPGRSVDRSFEETDGTFLLEELGDGKWEVEVRAEGLGPSVAVEVTLPRPSLEQLVFVLHPAASVAGAVLDPNGEPIPGARITTTTDPSKQFAEMTGRLELPETFADEDGNYELGELSTGVHTLVAEHADFASSEAVTVELQAGKRTEGIALELRRGGVLSGLVYDKDGEPMRGGQVFIQDTTNWQTIVTRTDEDGRFLKERMRPGSWQVTAMLGNSTAEGDDDVAIPGESDASAFFENMRFTVAEVKEGEETLVVLGAPPENPTVVHGRVTHGESGVSGALVSFFPEGASGLAAMKFQRVSADGTYEIQLDKPGPYLVQVQTHGETAFEQTNVEYSETIPEVERHELNVELPVGRISGRILDERGDPLPGARATLTTDGGISYGTFMGGNFSETTTKSDGSFEFDFLRPGTYSVAAGGSVFGGAFGNHSEIGRVVRNGIDVDEGETIDGLDFRLETAGEIVGSVVDATGGSVPGASIFVRDAQGRPLERFSMIATGPDGRFRYSGVAPGEYTVTARTADSATSVGAPAQVRSGETVSTELTLDPATVLLIRVIDKTGADVKARVSVLDEAGREHNGMLSYSDIVGGAGGAFQASQQRVGPLPPGSYTVLVVADDGRSSRKPVSITPGMPERSLKIRLRD